LKYFIIAKKGITLTVIKFQNGEQRRTVWKNIFIVLFFKQKHLNNDSSSGFEDYLMQLEGNFHCDETK